jgi:Concanavalin A-like lectin/glucanases superfamily
VRKWIIAAVAAVFLTAAAVAQAATISSWPLASNANDTTDGNNGTASSGVTFLSDATGPYAHFTKAADGKITVPHNNNLSPGAADVTATVTIRTTTMPGTSTNDFDLIRAAPTGKMYKMELFPHSGKATGQCVFIGLLNGTTSRITIHGTTNLADGQWHTIQCTKTSTDVTLKVDGAVAAAASIQIGTINLKKTAVFAIGYKPSSTGDQDLYDGDMKDVSVSIG